MKGSQDNEITFDDPSLPASAVREMVCMLYDGDRDFRMVTDPVALYRVADRFLLSRVKELCVYFIRKLLKQSGASVVIEALKLTHVLRSRRIISSLHSGRQNESDGAGSS